MQSIVQQPKEYETRVVKRFLWTMRIFTDEVTNTLYVRWMEHAQILQTWEWHSFKRDGNGWIDVAFADTEHGVREKSRLDALCASVQA